jgi:hypothetical protein
MKRKHREDFRGILRYEQYLDTIITDLVNALEPFAEKPSVRHNDFPCHSNITTKEKCGRCSRAFAAYYAIKQVNED